MRRTIGEHVPLEGFPGHIRKLYFSRRAFLWAVSSEMRGHDQQMTTAEAPSPCRISTTPASGLAMQANGCKAVLCVVESGVEGVRNPFSVVRQQTS